MSIYEYPTDVKSRSNVKSSLDRQWERTGNFRPRETIG